MEEKSILTVPKNWKFLLKQYQEFLLTKIKKRRVEEQKKINLGYLENTLSKYGCKNYKVKFINMDEYVDLIPQGEAFDWHRDYIDWKDILLP